MRTNRTRNALGTLALLVALCVSSALGNSTQIVVVPVANMYSGPSDQTDVVSQAIYGSNVTLLTAQGEWCKIQTADHYKGWRRQFHRRFEGRAFFTNAKGHRRRSKMEVQASQVAWTVCASTSACRHRIPALLRRKLQPPFFSSARTSFATSFSVSNTPTP